MKNETFIHFVSFFIIFLGAAPMSQCNIFLVQQTVHVSWLVLITANAGKNALFIIYKYSMKPEPSDINFYQRITYVNRKMKFVFPLFSRAHWTNGTKQENTFFLRKLHTQKK